MSAQEQATAAASDTATAPPGHPSGDERFALIDTALKRARFGQDQLIEILHVAQNVFGYLSSDVLLYIGHALRLPMSHVYGVASFYHLFTFDPPGDHTCTVCTGTACYVQGASAIVTAIERTYGLAPGQTTEDGRLTLAVARCIGSCGLAPVAVVDGAIRAHLDPDTVLATIAANLASDTPEDAAIGSATDHEVR